MIRCVSFKLWMWSLSLKLCTGSCFSLELWFESHSSCFLDFIVLFLSFSYFYFCNLLWTHNDSTCCLYCFWDNLLAALIGMCVWHFWRKCQLLITSVITGASGWLFCGLLFYCLWVKWEMVLMFSCYCLGYLQGCSKSYHHLQTLTGINCCFEFLLIHSWLS